MSDMPRITTREEALALAYSFASQLKDLSQIKSVPEPLYLGTCGLYVVRIDPTYYQYWGASRGYSQKIELYEVKEEALHKLVQRLGVSEDDQDDVRLAMAQVFDLCVVSLADFTPFDMLVAGVWEHYSLKGGSSCR